jgi:hypothetical protein
LLPATHVFHFGQTQRYTRSPLYIQAFSVFQRGSLADEKPGQLRVEINILNFHTQIAVARLLPVISDQDANRSVINIR